MTERVARRRLAALAGATARAATARAALDDAAARYGAFLGRTSTVSVA